MALIVRVNNILIDGCTAAPQINAFAIIFNRLLKISLFPINQSQTVIDARVPWVFCDESLEIFPGIAESTFIFVDFYQL